MAADLQATASGWVNFFKPTETEIFKINCLVAHIQLRPMHKSLWVFMCFVRSSCLTFGPSRFNGGFDLLIQGKPFVRTLQILFTMF